MASDDYWSEPTSWLDSDGQEWEFRLRWSVVEHRREVIGMEVISVSAPPKGLTTAVVRGIPWKVAEVEDRRGFEARLDALAEQVERIGDAEMPKVAEAVAKRQTAEQSARRRPGRRRTRGDDHYREVAVVYLRAIDGPSPRKAVADHFTVTTSTADDWIGVCRKRGLIPPAQRSQRKER